MLSGDSVNNDRFWATSPLSGGRLLIMQQLDYNNGNGVFLRFYKQVESQFCTGGCEERNRHCWNRYQETSSEDNAGWKRLRVY
jgi:hypothetical protein